MSKLDFSFFLEPPNLNVLGVLHIEALAPLSMVVAQPGAYYRSQSKPSELMLYGMLENALGWHLDGTSTGFKRENLLKNLQKQAKKLHGRNTAWKDHDWLNMRPNVKSSGVGFWSLLLHHLHFETPHVVPAVDRYEDLWSQHLHDNGSSFFGGSRYYDFRIEELVSKTRLEDPQQELNPRTKKRPPFIEMGDKKEYQRLPFDEAVALSSGKLNYMSVRSVFPQYYVTPKKREYVIPSGPYRFRCRTTDTVARMIQVALENPASPLYIGSNDGWVEATWEVL